MVRGPGLVRPERHGAITAVMKNQIDWTPLEQGAMRPSQGRTLAVMQVWRVAVLQRRQHTPPPWTMDAYGDDTKSIIGAEGVPGV